MECTRTLQILAVSGIFQALPSVAGQVFSSVGQPRHALLIAVVVSVLLVSLVGILAQYGIAAAAWSVVIAYLVATPLTLVRLRAVVGLDLVRLVREQAAIWIGVAAIALTVPAVGDLLPNTLPMIGRLLIEVCLCALAFVCIALVTLPKSTGRLADLFVRPRNPA
jgi:O-antigen/teichoic acid export membrane protein